MRIDSAAFEAIRHRLEVRGQGGRPPSTAIATAVSITATFRAPRMGRPAARALRPVPTTVACGANDAAAGESSLKTAMLNPFPDYSR
jgi:hypothetical protein